MSKYTTEVRFICEFYAGEKESKDYRDYNDYHNEYLNDKYNIDEIIDKAIPRVFEPDIVLFDPEYKNVLLHKILKHYYMREIGAETVALWKFYLNRTLKEILPYYNQRYKSELIKFDPLHDTDIVTTKDGKNTGTTGVSGTQTGTSNTHETTSGQKNTSGNEHYNEHGNGTRGTEENGTENIIRNKNGQENTTTEEKQKTTVDDTAHTTTENSTQDDTNGKHHIDRTHLDLYADTPQSGIQGLLGYDRLNGETVNDVKYLTNARRINEDEDETHEEHGTVTANGSTDYTDKTVTDGTNNATGNRTYEDIEAEKRDTTNNLNETTDNTTDGWRENKGQESNTGDRDSNTITSAENKSDTVTNSTENYVLHIAGKNGGKSYSKMLDEFRETFLNIDMEVIRELEPCFMQLW